MKDLMRICIEGRSACVILVLPAIETLQLTGASSHSVGTKIFNSGSCFKPLLHPGQYRDQTFGKL